MRARRPLTLAAAGLALALTVTACGSTSDHSTMTSSGAKSSAPASSDRDADIAFAQLMISHHQQAVEMADLALERASGPDVKILAAQIKAAQDPEITQMKAWLSSWGAPEQMQGTTGSGGSMDHSGMSMGGMTSAGMMSAEDTQELMDATGRDFDRMWLQMMIAHHQGALTMANGVLSTTSDAAVKQLAEAVVADQTDEIATMQKRLAG